MVVLHFYGGKQVKTFFNLNLLIWITVFGTNLKADIEFSLDLTKTIELQREASVEKLLANINPKGTIKGSVIASPSTHNPNYFFHWVRDAALVMDVVLDLYEESGDPIVSNHYERLLKDFVDSTLLRQKNSGLDGLGEPKYEVDGRPYTGPWGRPQNDGPALRAMVLIRFLHLLESKNPSDPYIARIFDTAETSNSAVRMDLLYLLKYYKEKSFDLWEEIKADNFYTRMVQHKAFNEAEQLALSRGAKDLAKQYAHAKENIAVSIFQHFDLKGERIYENIRRVEGIHYKYSGLDTATVLALNHTNVSLLSRQNRYVESTVYEIQKAFDEVYELNRKNKSEDLAPAIGRYPEDKYYGGNPWFLTTLAFAEHYYELASLTGDISFIETGDTFMRRALKHRGKGFRMDEQFSRYNGFMLSARDLTWSYGAFITAADARNAALANLR